MINELESKCLAMYVQINDHKTTYETVDQYLNGLHKGNNSMWDEFESEKERNKSITENCIVSIQVYWQTAVGFCVYSASNLEEAVNYALRDIKEDEL